MSEKATLMYLHALTPVHVGTGQAVSVIDLPIAREKATGWPVIPGSGLKGSFRNGKDDEESSRKYGSKDKAGDLLIGDLHLLCFPARSFYGTFAYVTCPLALNRYRRFADAVGIATKHVNIPELIENTSLVVTEDSVLSSGTNVIFDDLDLKAQPEDGISELAVMFAEILFATADEQKLFRERFCIASDAVFTYLAENATEVTARVRLEADTKTVQQGGLWYEESVPAEAIFFGVLATQSNDMLGIESQTIRLGGKESVGRGLCRLVVQNPHGEDK